MSEHTPGPWSVKVVNDENVTGDETVDPGLVYVECADPNADWICEVTGGYRLANAALIAAAPDTAAERDELRKGKKMWLHAAIELEAERDRLKATVDELLTAADLLLDAYEIGYPKSNPMNNFRAAIERAGTQK